jgi:DNA repair protein RecN (Recombination protein N)
LRGRQATIGGDRRALERELEVVSFQVREITAPAFRPGEDEELAARARRLRNAQGILEALDAAGGALGADEAEAAVDRAVLALTRAATLDPGLAELETQAGDVASLLGELRVAVAGAADEVAAEPAELEEVESRLAVLNDLRRKYGASLDDVLAFAEEAAGRRDELTVLLEEADSLGNDIAAAERAVAEAGEALSAVRRSTAEDIGTTALVHLRELGFARPVLRFEFSKVEPGPLGTDACELRFASDDQLEPGPVGRIASGGELSRLVLALRLATGAAEAAVAAFDEIDAGVGGAVALALGRKLARLAARRQVLCVTHLPQIAAQADAHYVIRREGTRAVVERVDGDARIEELTRMLAGMPESERGREHAAELLASAGREA